MSSAMSYSKPRAGAWTEEGGGYVRWMLSPDGTEASSVVALVRANGSIEIFSNPAMCNMTHKWQLADIPAAKAYADGLLIRDGWALEHQGWQQATEDAAILQAALDGWDQLVRDGQP